jgi:hypothetical protein
MTYNYLPEDERFDNSKLNGIYRVSFEVKVSSDEDLSLSDVTQSLTEGFERGFGEGFVDKVAELSVAKITKKAVKVLKVGDTVRIKESIRLVADIYEDDGYIFVGPKSDISEILDTDAVLMTVAGSIGLVNKICKDGQVEVANLDIPIDNWRMDGDPISVDLITVNADQIEKIDSEEVK